MSANVTITESSTPLGFTITTPTTHDAETVTIRVVTPAATMWILPPVTTSPSGTGQPQADYAEWLPQVAAALAERAETTTQLLIRDRLDDDVRGALAAAAGWQLHNEKHLVKADFGAMAASGATVVVPDEWTLTSLAELGQEKFAQRIYQASIGDPFETTTAENALTELTELMTYAGEAFAPEQWFAVDDAAGPIGVVLPQLVHDSPGEGTLFYVGVAPERRRAGFGTRLHTLGLALLQDLGAQFYLGSTDTRNTGMRKIFTTNNCPVIGVQSFYRR